MSTLAKTETADQVFYHPSNLTVPEDVAYHEVYPPIDTDAQFLVNRFTGMVVPNLPSYARMSHVYAPLYKTAEEVEQMRNRGEPLPNVAREVYQGVPRMSPTSYNAASNTQVVTNPIPVESDGDMEAL